MRITLIALVIVASIHSGKGQDFSKYFSVSADINKPIVNTEFIKAISKRGIKLSYREFLNDRFSIGGEASMAVYNDHIQPQVYTQDSLTYIYADIFSYVYSYTLAFSGDYFFITDQAVLPYAGLSIGAAYNQFTMYYNVYQQQDNRWGALVRPHAGAIFKFGKKSNWGILTDIHLDYATTKSNDTDYTNGFATVGFQIGVVLMR